jgi:hypothetical protein
MYLPDTKENWDVVKLESMLLIHRALACKKETIFLGGSRIEKTN